MLEGGRLHKTLLRFLAFVVDILRALSNCEWTICKENKHSNINHVPCLRQIFSLSAKVCKQQLGPLSFLCCFFFNAHRLKTSWLICPNFLFENNSFIYSQLLFVGVNLPTIYTLCTSLTYWMFDRGDLWRCWWTSRGLWVRGAKVGRNTWGYPGIFWDSDLTSSWQTGTTRRRSQVKLSSQEK